MICEQIREAIDTDSKSEAMAIHLSACTACRTHDAEMSSLLSILTAQPRVKAPVDFDARLQARLANEEVRLLTLVNSLPFIEAPANFDFQLRRRMAQAQAGKTKVGLPAWVEQFFSQSFSLGQATSALAAVALIVAVSVVQFSRSGNQPITSETTIAKHEAVKNPVRTVSDATTAIQASPAELPTLTQKALGREARQVMPVANRRTATAPVMESKLIASNMNERVIINAKTRQEMKVTVNGYAYGQQLAKLMPAPKVEPMSEVF
jgi:hypothetical protein